MSAGDGAAPRRGRAERAALVLALTCVLVALTIDPVIRAVSPHLHVDMLRSRLADPGSIARHGQPDPWGRPWEHVIDARGNPRPMPREVTRPGLQLGSGWSVGPDGINQWGVGDDIVISQAERSTAARLLSLFSPRSLLLVALGLVWLTGLRWALARARAPTVTEECLRAVHLASLPALLATRAAAQLSLEPAHLRPLNAAPGLAPGAMAFAGAALAVVTLTAFAWRFTRPRA